MKLRTIIVLLCAITLVSCNKEEQDENSIIGDWHVYKTCLVTNTGDYVCSDVDYNESYNADGTYENDIANQSANAVWTLNGNQLERGGTPCIVYWTVAGKEWYITWGDGDYEKYYEK